MNSDKKDGKRPYEPPRIYELEVDMAQAMGKSLCTKGNRVGGPCDHGNRAGTDCSKGNRAGVECDKGTHGAPPPKPEPCMSGHHPS